MKFVRSEASKRQQAEAARVKRALRNPCDKQDENERRSLWRRYRLTPEDVNALVWEQFGRCAVCGEVLDRYTRDFHIDHDHDTGRVRGLLHRRCNTALGTFEKTRELHAKFEEYLSRGGC